MSVYLLPDILDVSSVAVVHRDLVAKRGGDLDIDASNVRRIAGLGLQLLVAAGATWTADGQKLRVVNGSPTFAEAIRISGYALACGS
jgi:anti-anti-sigma regulatory factor